MLNDTSLNLENVIVRECSKDQRKSSLDSRINNSKRRKLNESSLIPEDADFDLEQAIFHVHKDLQKEKEESRR